MSYRTVLQHEHFKKDVCGGRGGGERKRGGRKHSFSTTSSTAAAVLWPSANDLIYSYDRSPAVVKIDAPEFGASIAFTYRGSRGDEVRQRLYVEGTASELNSCGSPSMKRLVTWLKSMEFEVVVDMHKSPRKSKNGRISRLRG